MALMEDDSAPAGAPDWVITYGDMMSLLLTFFIMLASFSEMKDKNKYQAMVEAVMRRFGYDMSMSSLAPGSSKPRNALIARLAVAGRAKRLDVMRGGDKILAPLGDYSRVRMVRPGVETAVGTVLYFDEASAELTDEHRLDLQRQVAAMSGKPQRIEIRGHTSLRPLPKGSPYRDLWDLAYQRCRNTNDYLVNELGIDSRRIRLSVAGPNEPVSASPDPQQQRQNPRVEVFLLDEVVDDPSGTDQEHEVKFRQETETEAAK